MNQVTKVYSSIIYIYLRLVLDDYLEHAVATTMTWYVVFCGRKPGIYDSRGVCSEYVIGFSGTAFQSYPTRMQAEEAYVAFLDHQNELRKLEPVTQKAEHVAKNWSWKD
jgi:viroplasmin and RNaseH domain-containing protein